MTEISGSEVYFNGGMVTQEGDLTLRGNHVGSAEYLYFSMDRKIAHVTLRLRVTKKLALEIGCFDENRDIQVFKKEFEDNVLHKKWNEEKPDGYKWPISDVDHRQHTQWLNSCKFVNTGRKEKFGTTYRPIVLCNKLGEVKNDRT